MPPWRRTPINPSSPSARWAQSVARERLSATLIGLFASLALVLAAVGLYGVIGYGISRRTRKLGLRRVLAVSDRQVLSARSDFHHGLLVPTRQSKTKS